MISAIFILNTTYSIFLLLLLLQHLPSSSFFHNAMSPHGSLSVISQITGSCGFSTSSLFRQLTVYSYGTCYQGPDNLASGSRSILLQLHHDHTDQRLIQFRLRCIGITEIFAGQLLLILTACFPTSRKCLIVVSSCDKQHCSPDNCAVDSRSQIRNLSNQMQIPAPSCLGIRCLLPDHVRCP